MNRRRVCKYLLALMGAAWMVSGRIAMAQPPDQVVVPVPEDFTISLRVLKPDGTPLRRGLISILTLSTRGVEARSSTSLVHPANPKPGARRVETDDEGRLNTQLRARRGRYSLYVRAPGQGVAVVPLLEFEHKNPRFVEEVQVRLQPEGAVRVTVRDQKNVPMGGAHVFLVPVDADGMVNEKSRNDSSSLDWLVPVDDMRRVTRDGDGLLEMSGLRPGQYFATVSVPGYQVASPTPVRTISIKGGSITPLDFVLEPPSNALCACRSWTRRARPYPSARSTSRCSSTSPRSGRRCPPKWRRPSSTPRTASCSRAILTWSAVASATRRGG